MHLSLCTRFQGYHTVVSSSWGDFTSGLQYFGGHFQRWVCVCRTLHFTPNFQRTFRKRSVAENFWVCSQKTDSLWHSCKFWSNSRVIGLPSMIDWPSDAVVSRNSFPHFPKVPLTRVVPGMCNLALNLLEVTNFWLICGYFCLFLTFLPTEFANVQSFTKIVSFGLFTTLLFSMNLCFWDLCILIHFLLFLYFCL